MALLKKILDKFNGLHYRQEYLCLGKGSHLQPLHAYLVNNKRVVKDITTAHLFIGYNPMIFAFPSFPGIELPPLISIVFSQHALSLNAIFASRDALAFMELKNIAAQAHNGEHIYYYEATKGQHSFVSFFQQRIIALSNHLYNRKPGNVFLQPELYRQVQIAYAIPRTISMISLQKDALFNLFPTDLHGQVDSKHYIISLRSAGKACQQVESLGRLVIAQVHADTYKTVYRLGKNHMQELKDRSNFPFDDRLSATFQWPLPQQAIGYMELALLDGFIHGIHKIMLFKVIHSEQLLEETSVLSHIHNSYASWRYKKKLPGNYLLR